MLVTAAPLACTSTEKNVWPLNVQCRQLAANNTQKGSKAPKLVLRTDSY